MDVRRSAHPAETRAAVRGWQAEGLSVGLVPTMGALHEGHLSLIRACASECDRTAVSIYVNPTQFGPGEDLAQYPRRRERDCELAGRAGTDLLYCPGDADMYPEGFCTYVIQEGLTEVLEGAFRPTHFRGVLTVVCKLLHVLPADRAYFGQKDFQQSVVIRRMVRDLNMATDIRVLPTVREPDGLALSSRNDYLSRDERGQATCLFRALVEAKRLYDGGETDADAAREAMGRVIAGAPLARADYVEIVDAETLRPLERLSERAVAVLAVRVGDTRLIDNHPLCEGLSTG